MDDVVALINGQIEAGEEESVERVRNVVQDVVRDWRAQGLSPFAVLRCLQASEVLDPMSELDVQALFQSAHVELAGGDSLLQWRVGDVDGDGEDELIALDAEMAVRVYHMAALENQEIATDVALKADLLLSFGDAVANEDGKQALSCYRRALELQDTPETREKVAAICSVLASTSAKEGDFDDALASAQTAVDMVDSAFSRCTSLCSVALPDSVLEIDTYAFNGCNQLIMTVVEGSYAHQYAIEQGIFYRYADAGE